jgi:ABC-type uncharacterized transport system YnjBCD substrate-binding protein
MSSPVPLLWLQRGVHAYVKLAQKGSTASTHYMAVPRHVNHSSVVAMALAESLSQDRSVNQLTLTSSSQPHALQAAILTEGQMMVITLRATLRTQPPCTGGTSAFGYLSVHTLNNGPHPALLKMTWPAY